MKYFLFDVQDKVWKNNITVGVSKMKIKNNECLFFQMQMQMQEGDKIQEEDKNPGDKN